jgi:hypothetical protein
MKEDQEDKVRKNPHLGLAYQMQQQQRAQQFYNNPQIQSMTRLQPPREQTAADPYSEIVKYADNLKQS